MRASGSGAAGAGGGDVVATGGVGGDGGGGGGGTWTRTSIPTSTLTCACASVGASKRRSKTSRIAACRAATRVPSSQTRHSADLACERGRAVTGVPIADDTWL